MPKPMKIKELAATIGSRKYRLVPAASCKGCAFEQGCYSLARQKRCPVFNDYTLASDIDVIFKEIK